MNHTLAYMTIDVWGSLPHIS